MIFHIPMEIFNFDILIVQQGFCSLFWKCHESVLSRYTGEVDDVFSQLKAQAL